MKWTIGKRISSALLLFLTLFVGVVLSFMVVYGDLRQEYDSLFQHVTSDVILIKNLSTAVHDQSLDIQGFVLTGRDQYLKNIRDARAGTQETLKQLEASLHDAEILQQLGTVRLMLAQYDRKLDFIMLVRREKGMAAAERYLEYGDFLTKAEQELQELLRLSNDRAGLFMSRSSAAVRRLHVAFVLIFLFSITVAVIIALRVRSLIMGPLQHLVAAARSMSQGRFDDTVAIKERDEFAEVGQAFNTMADSLKQAFGELAQGERKYRELADLLPMIVFEIDSRGYYTYVNQAGYALTGYTREDVEQGLHCTRLVAKEYHHVLADGLSRLLSGETLLNREYMLQCRDGSTFPCLFFSAPIVSQGKIVGARGSILNISDLKQAEEALKESERKFRCIFEQSYQLMGLLAPDGTVLAANRTALDFIGVTEKEVLGKPYWKTLWWTHSSEEQEKLRKEILAAARGELVRFKTTHCSHDGALVHVDFSIKPVIDEEGCVVCLIPEGRDITDLKMAEEEMLLQKIFSDTLIQASPAFIVAISQEGRVLLMNDAMLTALGYTRAEVIGAVYLATFVSPEDRSRLDAVFHTIIADHVPTVSVDRILAKDGSEILVEWHGQSVMQDKKLNFFIGVGIDITGRKQAETELRRAYNELQDANARLQESDQTLKMAIDIAKTAVWEFDLQTRMVRIKKFPEALELDFPLSDLPQSVDDYQQLYRPDSWEKIRAALNAYLRGETDSFEAEACMRGKHLNWLWVYVTGKITDYAPDGTPQKMLCMSVDITKIKQAEEEILLTQEQLIQADKMIALGTLVAGVAHEINNPNNFVMLNTPLIQEIWKGIAPVLEEYFRENGDFKAGGMPYSKLRDGIPTLLNGILDGSRRISTIVKELKDFARPDEVSMKQSVDINAAVKASLSLLHNMIAKSTHAFTVTYGDNLPLITGNSQRLEQVFINIIQNACQALPDTGRGIHVATAYDGHAVSISIKDEGTGIPQEKLGQLMDPFFTTKRGTGGTGLGLSISNKIITDHGGRIDVQSRVGEGSTFTVLLPLKPVKEKKKILIADDEEKQRDIMYLTLSQNLAYEIRMVENGTDACILLGKWRPDLILLDINMPGMNGVEVCRRIKNDADFSDVQVIIVTGLPDRQRMKDIQAMGFTDLCEKPFSTAQLQAMVVAVLDRKSDKNA